MKILVVQNRMGIGDTIIFLPFIKALSKKFNAPISLLVKENSKADQYLYQTNYIERILFLERDKKNNNRHGGFLGSINLIKEIKKQNFDKMIIFNSSLRFHLIAKLSRISLTELEINNLSSELDNILNWIEQLSELDTEGINPVFSSFDEEETKYRTDEINDGGYREDIISNAPLTEDGFFLVPKVVD